MIKLRIVEITEVSGTIRYVIQRKRFLFGWVAAGVSNRWMRSYTADNFSLLSHAKEYLKYFDGTKPTIKVVHD